jgi:prepilin-type N-terminal cleavage/methylation domain-containing protein/prepilin-type processing-associated H-X9-DG protein
MRRSLAKAFTLAELLVVLGVLALLLAIIAPPLQMARRSAMNTVCQAQLQQISRALEAANNEFGYYPYFDDGGRPIRYTWIDVLIQRQLMSSSGGGGGASQLNGAHVTTKLGYCPADSAPDPLNSVRNADLLYPPNHASRGIDYSYGLAVPLSSGGWAQRLRTDEDLRPRRFVGHELNAARRLLAADAYDSEIYNLSGDAIGSVQWNVPTQYDNTIAWARHTAATQTGAFRTNALFQDGHVGNLNYLRGAAEPVNTARAFVWHPGESANVNPESRYGDNWYPSRMPPNYRDGLDTVVFPNEMLPYWYTRTRSWTMIEHK